MIEKADNYYETLDGKPITSKCSYCGKRLTDKWVTNSLTGDLCINCAQRTMRILFQDIIEYHNGVSVSLLDIMYHGDEHKQKLLDKARMDKSNETSKL